MFADMSCKRVLSKAVISLMCTALAGVGPLSGCVGSPTDPDLDSSQPLPSLTAEAGPDKAITDGGSCTLEGSASSGVGPYTYAWSPATGLDNPAAAQPTASPVQTTQYTLTVIDNVGATATDTVRVSVVPTAQAGPDKTIAVGGSCRLEGSASGGTGPYTYSWSPATGLDNPSIAQPTASPSQTTEYTLTVTDGGGATAADKIIVNVSATITYFFDSFEQGLGNWNLSGMDWALAPEGVQGSNWCLGYKDYPPGAAASISLKRSIDLSGSSSPILSLWYKAYGNGYGFWTQTRYSGWWVGDLARCYASKDGGVTWGELSVLTQTSTWSYVVLDVSGYKSDMVKMKFVFSSDGDDIRGGVVVIDAVEIKEKE